MHKGKCRPFIRGGFCRVEKTIQQAPKRRPKVTIDDEALFIAIRLAKAGYCSGDPKKVLMTRADLVMAMLDYETFEADYESQYIELNKGE